MKRILTIGLGMLMLASGALQVQAQGQKKRAMTLGVAFYNLENLFDTINNNGKYDLEFSPQGDHKWDSHKYRSKIHNMATAIASLKTKTTPMGPAVIGVSEIENESVLNDLVGAEPLKPWDLKVIHHDSPDRRGVDVGLLYNPRLFKPINVTNHTLVVPALPNFRTRDQMVVTGLMGGNNRVAVIVNHWPSRRGGEEQSSWLREAAAELCKHIADSLLAQDPKMGIIIMGDLNDDPYNKSCSQILGAVKNPKDVKPLGYYNPFWKKLDDGIGSYIYRGSWDLFDQIIINSNLVDGSCGLEFIGAEVHNKEMLKQAAGQYKGYPLRTFSGGVWTDGFSDHFPTEIYLKKSLD